MCSDPFIGSHACSIHELDMVHSIQAVYTKACCKTTRCVWTTAASKTLEEWWCLKTPGCFVPLVGRLSPCSFERFLIQNVHHVFRKFLLLCHARKASKQVARIVQKPSDPIMGSTPARKPSGQLCQLGQHNTLFIHSETPFLGKPLDNTPPRGMLGFPPGVRELLLRPLLFCSQIFPSLPTIITKPADTEMLIMSTGTQCSCVFWQLLTKHEAATLNLRKAASSW